MRAELSARMIGVQLPLVLQIMAGNTSTAALRSFQVGTRPASSWTHPRRMASFALAPWTTGGPISLQVYASKSGFGAQPGSGPKKKPKKTRRASQVKEKKDPITLAQQMLTKKQQPLRENADTTEDVPSTEHAGNTEQAPSLVLEEGVQSNIHTDEMFERRLAEIQRAAEEQKVLTEQKKYGPIDYDAPSTSPSKGWSSNLGAKVGIGLAVVVFGLIFALGDFLPGSLNADKSNTNVKKELTKEESSKLQAQAQGFEDLLKTTPDDRTSLEGAAVSYAELGDFDRAAEYLSKIIQKSPGDSEAFRLLAEVQNGKGDLDASASSYRAAIRASSNKESLILIRGLTDTLLALKKPSEAVGELLAVRARMKYNLEQGKSTFQQTMLPSTSGAPERLQGGDDTGGQDEDIIDAVTLELLLGKAYAAWDGHTGDAVAVYDGLIGSYPEDYRGFLAKGVLLKGQKKGADAERMFMQARYLAPPNSKSLVDLYSGRQPS